MWLSRDLLGKDSLHNPLPLGERSAQSNRTQTRKLLQAKAVEGQKGATAAPQQSSPPITAA